MQDSCQQHGGGESGNAEGSPKDGRYLSCSAHDFEPWREFIVANGELRAPACGESGAVR
jgi:hypothetical protein